MKNFTHFLGIVLFAITLHSCTQKNIGGELTIDSATLDVIFLNAIPYEGGTSELKFESSLGWTVTTSDTRTSSWLDVRPTSGEAGTATITITAAENTTPNERQSKITISAGALTENINITQKQKNALTVTSARFEVSQDGENIQVEVKANIEFEVSIADNSKEWITQVETKALKSHSLSFDIAASEDLERRDGSITISAGDLSEEIKVFQSGGKILILSEKIYVLTKLGGTIRAEISSNFDFEVKMPSVDWVEELSTKAISSHTRYFEASINSSYDPRTAEIVFKSSDGEVSDTLVINQDGKSRGYYESTDYSQDGKVLTLQTASLGNGINVVIVGDGFSDKDMGRDGIYEQRMREAMNHFFSEEPYKTYSNYYNVYTVKAVSKNEVYKTGSETIFECKFGEGTLIRGNHEKVFEYALKVPTMRSHNDLTIITILNSPNYAGTCYMYINNASIAYCPIVYAQDESFRQIVAHEAAGHGFAKLGDEYYYSGTISSGMINAYKPYKELDWLANIEFTNDPTTISWAHFLSDSRYTNEVGIFEGALGYTYGVYRPTEQSIMRSNTGGFNAPSREAIFKRIITLSGGRYNYEDFVVYDAKNRTTNAMTARRAQAAKVDESTFVPLAPPVFMGSSPKVSK